MAGNQREMRKKELKAKKDRKNTVSPKPTQKLVPKKKKQKNKTKKKIPIIKKQKT